MTEFKICGLTRPEDAALAAELGAAYIGAIFAGGARTVTASRAAEVLAAGGSGAKRVGVFAGQRPREIAEVAATAALDVVQLHDDPSPSRIAEAREATGCEIWAVARVKNGLAPAGLSLLAETADALLLDSRVAGQLGGTGRAFDWMALAPVISRLRGHVTLVLAGGLSPENVGRGIALIAPHVVDVSSGVESAPGIKDPARMRAFADAVRGATA